MPRASHQFTEREIAWAAQVLERLMTGGDPRAYGRMPEAKSWAEKLCVMRATCDAQNKREGT